MGAACATWARSGGESATTWTASSPTARSDRNTEDVMLTPMSLGGQVWTDPEIQDNSG